MASGTPRLSASRARAQNSVAGAAVLARRLTARRAVLCFAAAAIVRSGGHGHTADWRRLGPGELVLGNFQIEQAGRVQSQNVAFGPFAQERQAGDRIGQVEVP